MSTTEKRTARKVALPIAAEFAVAISAGCETVEFAGSLRRLTPTVGDIEICCIPKRTALLNLFGEKTAELSLLDDELFNLFKGGEWRLATVIDKNQSEYQLNGERMKKIEHTPSGLLLDLFITDKRRWGAIFTIRTGHRDFSARLVSHALKRDSFVDDGLVHRHRRIYSSEQKPLPCKRGDRCPFITNTESEVAFFLAVGAIWIAPELRTDKQKVVTL